MSAITIISTRTITTPTFVGDAVDTSSFTTSLKLQLTARPVVANTDGALVAILETSRNGDPNRWVQAWTRVINLAYNSGPNSPNADGIYPIPPVVVDAFARIRFAVD